MKHNLFTLASVLCLLLCVTTAVLWLVTLFRPIEYSSTRDFYSAKGLTSHSSPEFQRYKYLGIAHGVISVQWLQNLPERPRFPIVASFRGYPLKLPLRPATLGFSAYLRRDPAIGYGPEAKYRQFSFPLWLIAAAAAGLPGRWALICYRNRKRIETERCAQCGYDLRAAPSRCPECGTIVPHKS